jgi:hypothetical protein
MVLCEPRSISGPQVYPVWSSKLCYAYKGRHGSVCVPFILLEGYDEDLRKPCMLPVPDQDTHTISRSLVGGLVERLDI